jgi:hypothetical protein
MCEDEEWALTMSLICDPETSDLDFVHVAPNAVDRGMLRPSGHPTPLASGEAHLATSVRVLTVLPFASAAI